jgi:hypothetical protein
MLDDVDSSSSLSFRKALGSVCPKSPRLPMRRTSDDSKEAANGREEKPLKPPVRRTSMEVDLPSAERLGRRGTSTRVGSSSSETRPSFRDGDLSSVIGKLLHELDDLELVSSDDEYSCEDDVFDDSDDDSVIGAPCAAVDHPSVVLTPGTLLPLVESASSRANNLENRRIFTLKVLCTVALSKGLVY